MRKNLYSIFTILLLFMNITKSFGDIYDVQTGYSFQYPVCPGIKYAYTTREIWDPNSIVVWTVKNGEFNGHTTTTTRYGNTPIEVVWDDVLEEGKLSYYVIGNDLLKDNTTQKILSIKNIAIPSVKIDNFSIKNNTITIPRGKKGTVKITIPEIWYKQEWKDFSECKITTFEWTVPKTFGGSGNAVKRGSTYTFSYDESNGDGEKIKIRPASECNNNSYGKTYTITIKRTGSAFNGTIKDTDISGTKNYEYADLFLENVNILSGANINLNGYNSVKIAPEFHAETGSYVHIFNTPPGTKNTKAVTQETQIKNTELNANAQAALYQNRPNPVTSETIIPCIIPETAQNACLQIVNSFGQVIQKIPIPETGHTGIPLSRKGLTAGIYFYSLVIDNRAIDTKRMIITTY